MAKEKKELKKTLSTELGPAEMSNVLRYMIKNNVKLSKGGRETISCNLVGEAGIGKTSICKQIAAEFDHHFVRMNLAEIEVPD